MSNFLALNITHNGITFAFYVKENEPGEIFDMVDSKHYVRLATKEELAVLDEIESEVEAIRFRLTVEAADRWPAWVPFAESAIQKIWPGELPES